VFAACFGTPIHGNIALEHNAARGICFDDSLLNPVLRAKHLLHAQTRPAHHVLEPWDAAKLNRCRHFTFATASLA
jgi:hypothetical protein